MMPNVGKYTVPYMDDMGNFNLQPENDSLQKKGSPFPGVEFQVPC